MSILTQSIDLGNPVSDHPLNRGLVSWWLPLPNNSGGSKLFDLKNRNHGTLSSVRPTWVSGRNGFQALSFNAVSTDVDISSIPTSFSNGLSCAMTIAPDATGGTRRDYFGRWSTSDDSFQFVILSGITASQWSFYTKIDGSLRNATGGTVTVSRFTRILASHDNSTMRLYVDGSLVASAAASGSVGTYTNNAYIGRSGDSYGGGTIGNVKLWDRAISESEAIADYDQWRRGFPNTLRRIPSRVWSFASPPATGSYTLAMDAGSYGVTGSAVGLKASRQLASASGSYSLTGSAVALKAGRKVAVVAGSYSITGSAVSLKASRQLASASGSYTLTGQDTGLKAGRKIAVASGTYTSTGQDVALNYSGAAGSYTLAIESGSYSLTGSPIGLIAARVLGIGTGAYSLTGSAVGLKAGRQLAVEAASYALNGFAVALKSARQIAALSGSYTLTGQDITFTYTPAAVDLLSGLGAYYRLDGDLTDSSGNGRDLTGSGTYQAGKLNQELATGSGTRTPLGGVTDAAVTILAWLTSTAGGSGDGVGCSVGFGSDLLTVRAIDDSIQWLFDSGSEWSELVSTATRYHVAVTLDGTTAKLYLNGAQVYTGTVPVASGWSSDIFQVQTTGDVTTPVDEVAIYTRAITAAEVSALYNSGLGYDPTNVGPVSRFTIAGTDRSRVTIPGTDRSRVTVAGTLRN